MRSYPGKWIGALALALTLPTWAAEPPSRPGTPAAAEPATQEPAPSLAQAFDLRSAAVQDVVRTAAATQGTGYRPAGYLAIERAAQEPEAELENRAQPHRLVPAPRTGDFKDCRFFDCDEDHPRSDPLETAWRNRARDQLIVSSERDYDVWLSCQDSHDNLATTQERFDSCNAVDPNVDRSYGWWDFAGDVLFSKP